jgi:hypothetical protein
MDTIWQPQIFYRNKEPNDPTVETIIAGGTLVKSLKKSLCDVAL